MFKLQLQLKVPRMILYSSNTLKNNMNFTTALYKTKSPQNKVVTRRTAKAEPDKTLQGNQ